MHIYVYIYTLTYVYMYSPWGHKGSDVTEPLSLSLEWTPGLYPKAALWFLGSSSLVSTMPLFLH